MIKIDLATNEMTRETVPQFLNGLAQESLNDLSWADESLGVSGIGYWPEVVNDTAIDTNTHKYGDEILTSDALSKTVLVSHEVLALSQLEIDALTTAKLAEIASKNKADCKSHILSEYTEEQQRNAGLGLYLQSEIDTMAAFILASTTEEGRVLALLTACTTVTELLAVETPTWPTVI